MHGKLIIERAQFAANQIVGDLRAADRRIPFKSSPNHITQQATSRHNNDEFERMYEQSACGAANRMYSQCDVRRCLLQLTPLLLLIRVR